MNIENLLKYQKRDEDLFKVEQKLANSAYRRKAAELTAVAKKAQAKSTELENHAEKLIVEIGEIKEKYNLTKKKAEGMVAANLENMTMEELEKANELKQKIMQNLAILEKMLQKNMLTLMNQEEYINLVCDQLEILPETMIIHRLTGDGKKDDLVGPLWSLKKWEVLNAIDDELKKRNSYQGIKYKNND